MAIIHLGRSSPIASSNLPGSPLGTGGGPKALLPYLVLLRAGFTVPRTVASRAVRSYRTFSPLPAPEGAGGLFSVALSMGSRPPGVTWRPVRRSPDFPPGRNHDDSTPATAWPTPAFPTAHYSESRPPATQPAAHGAARQGDDYSPVVSSMAWLHSPLRVSAFSRQAKIRPSPGGTSLQFACMSAAQLAAK